MTVMLCLTRARAVWAISNSPVCCDTERFLTVGGMIQHQQANTTLDTSTATDFDLTKYSKRRTQKLSHFRNKAQTCTKTILIYKYILTDLIISIRLLTTSIFTAELTAMYTTLNTVQTKMKNITQGQYLEFQTHCQHSRRLKKPKSSNRIDKVYTRSGVGN